MQIIETYGKYIEKFGNEDPAKARWLLKTGWSAQNLKFRFAPDKRLIPAHRYLAHLMMNHAGTLKKTGKMFCGQHFHTL